jgi:hypothetical protein
MSQQTFEPSTFYNMLSQMVWGAHSEWINYARFSLYNKNQVIKQLLIIQNMTGTTVKGKREMRENCSKPYTII